MRPDLLHDEAAWLYRSLGERGLITGSSGNVSALMPPDGMVITPTGGSPDTPFKMVDVSLDGTARGAGLPSSEWAMHAAIYGVCRQARFIVHTHADACTALACLNQGLPPFHYMVGLFGGFDVRCAPYVTFGTPELAALAAQSIEGRSACLLANHGMILWGTSASHALSQAILLETLCRQYLLALSAGKPRLLTDAEMQAAAERFKTYGHR